MNNFLMEEASRHGDRIQIVSSVHLVDLKNSIEQFSQKHELNGFQKWIINSFYNYNTNRTDFVAKSIIVIAISHPFCADVVFSKGGREYTGRCLVSTGFDKVDNYLKKTLEKLGHQAEIAENLPLKRLAVQSGLSEYGRNNITYIDEMGSNYSLIAYFSDIPCEKDIWRDVKMAGVCENCSICMDACPTGAIRTGEFLIDNQRCLSAVNEVAGDFPQWLSPSVHHTCYDCLRCQERCPMNIGHLDKMEGCFVFSEQETEMLLEGAPIEEFSEDTKEKIYKLGLDKWYAAIPRNISVLIERGLSRS